MLVFLLNGKRSEWTLSAVANMNKVDTQNNYSRVTPDNQHAALHFWSVEQHRVEQFHIRTSFLKGLLTATALQKA